MIGVHDPDSATHDAGRLLGRTSGVDRSLAFAAIHLLVGAWLLASPYALKGALVDGLDDLAVGVVLVVMAAYGAYGFLRRHPVNRWALLLGVFAGMWLLAFSLEYGEGALLMYDSVVAGGLLVAADVVLYRRAFRNERVGR